MANKVTIEMKVLSKQRKARRRWEKMFLKITNSTAPISNKKMMLCSEAQKYYEQIALSKQILIMNNTDFVDVIE